MAYNQREDRKEKERCSLCLSDCNNNDFVILEFEKWKDKIRLEKCKECGNIWITDQWWGKED